MQGVRRDVQRRRERERGASEQLRSMQESNADDESRERATVADRTTNVFEFDRVPDWCTAHRHLGRELATDRLLFRKPVIECCFDRERSKGVWPITR